MPVTLAVLLVAAVAAIAVWRASRTPGSLDPIDPEAEERWLLRWLGSHPRWGRTARSIDERVAGGLMLVISLGSILAAALAVGLLFDMVDASAGLARWDRSVAEWGSRNATERSTGLLDVLTDLGGYPVVWIIALVVAAVDVATRRNLHVVGFLVVVLVGISIMNNGLKLVVDRERPDVVHLVSASGSSFPSGHSAAAAAAWCAFALVVGRRRRRSVRALLAGFAAVISFAVAASRALLGVHWMTDVLAGLVVGWTWFLLSALIFGGRLQHLGEPLTRGAATLHPDPEPAPQRAD